MWEVLIHAAGNPTADQVNGKFGMSRGKWMNRIESFMSELEAGSIMEGAERIESIVQVCTLNEDGTVTFAVYRLERFQ